MIEDNVTFLVLHPELNTGGLICTIKSIKVNFPKASILCMVGNNATENDLDSIKKLCPVLQAENTITSLINLGVKKSQTKWCFTIMSGCVAKNGMFRKYNLFFKHEKEILYSVVDLKSWLFPNATINGILLSKEILKEVGDFPNEESIVESKTWWTALATEKGYKLKGIVGTKIF